MLLSSTSALGKKKVESLKQQQCHVMIVRNCFYDKKTFLIKIISCCSPQLQLLERRKQRAFNSSLVSCDGAGWQQATVSSTTWVSLHKPATLTGCTACTTSSKQHEWQPSALVCAVAAAALWQLLKNFIQNVFKTNVNFRYQQVNKREK